ncbi:MAG TPA: hypothetical protein P5080_05380 [Candidatus Paceibacterota bacterium]|nr:hypothetical protein [Candidatus Pacearchaeota archaeon]HRZ51379.1 hypothetical protein [Candidatus Paceibacterota bacterium]HSA37101.1 hypothetical protein [Candidatus Paceibacterota bacterium]
MKPINKNSSLDLNVLLALVLNLALVFALYPTLTANAADCSLKDKPKVSAGADQTVQELKNVSLVGSAKDAKDLEYEWTCNGGTVESASLIEANFIAPEVEQDTYFVCTLKATSECGFDYDTANILVLNKPGEVLGEADQAILSAEPSSGCAPLNNVSLTADIGENNDASREYTYYFYCNGDTDWNKTLITHENSFTAKDLCNYDETGTYNAYVKVTAVGQPDIKESIMIAVDDCKTEDNTDSNANVNGGDQTNGTGDDSENTQNQTISVNQLVSNITAKTTYSDSADAKAGDDLSFQVTLEAVGRKLPDVVLADILPNGIDNVRDITIDGKEVNGNLGEGIRLEDIDEGTAMTVVFTATIEDQGDFDGNEPTLTNTVSARCADDSCSGRDSAEINLADRIKTEVLTTNNTGFGDNPLTDSFVIPAGLSLLLVWMFKTRLIQFDKWADGQKLRYSVYKSRKNLNLKRSKLIKKDISDRWS